MNSSAIQPDKANLEYTFYPEGTTEDQIETDAVQPITAQAVGTYVMKVFYKDGGQDDPDPNYTTASAVGTVSISAVSVKVDPGTVYGSDGAAYDGLEHALTSGFIVTDTNNDKTLALGTDYTITISGPGIDDPDGITVRSRGYAQGQRCNRQRNLPLYHQLHRFFFRQLL